MSAFTDIVHKVATIGEHVVEYVEGNTHITLNGTLVAAQDLEQLIAALQEVAPLAGAVAGAVAAA